MNDLWSNRVGFDREGHPITVKELVQLYDDEEYRILARDMAGPWTVVTAWLGTDQSLRDAEQPLIFGTAVLDDDGKVFDDRELYAASEAEALAHHATAVAEMTSAHKRGDTAGA